MHISKENIDNRFTYHTPVEGQPEKYIDIRKRLRETAHLINMLCPDSEEKHQALFKLEEAMFYANASIARHPQSRT